MALDTAMQSVMGAVHLCADSRLATAAGGQDQGAMSEGSCDGWHL